MIIFLLIWFSVAIYLMVRPGRFMQFLGVVLSLFLGALLLACGSPFIGAIAAGASWGLASGIRKDRMMKRKLFR
ncbi:hypothetical protein SAMN03159353_11073 [Cedecea sp. NFIX57]|nr:hypothetical protein SAMN03159353_11073 [Cedecea sp. NFIX57]